ncbi:MAG TPA: hypothetical protein VK891_01720, partial [Euzebyales bacterium]|nr:hypothetical protein [Euzebyales bacterium]
LHRYGPVDNHVGSVDGRGGRVDDRVPLALYCWTFASSVLAHAAFFGLPVSAVTGGIGMGVVVVALVLVLRRAPGRVAAR